MVHREKSFVTALRTMTYAVSTALLSLYWMSIGRSKDLYNGIDLAERAGRTVRGYQETTLIKATVLVTVKDHAITDCYHPARMRAGKPAERSCRG
jgi:hypothetical protein